MKHYRWFLALGIWLALLPGTSGAGPNHGPVQVVSTRVAGDDEGNTEPIGTGDYGSDVGVGWYTVGAGGAVSSIDVLLEGSIGQALAGDTNPDDPVLLVSGFWAPDGSDYTVVGAAEPLPGTTFVSQAAERNASGPTLSSADAPVVEFSLLPISPNPSHGVALVAWTVPRASQVRLTVHDVMGRQVASLAEGPHAAGRYHIRWSTSSLHGGLSAGMYFVRLQTPDGVFVRRVVMAP